MKRCWRILKVLAVVSAFATVLLVVTASFCYRRFCELDSRFYHPDGDVGIRLRIERSFEMPVSYTVIQRGDAVALETFVPPGTDCEGRWSMGCWRSRDLDGACWTEVQRLVRTMEIPVLANVHQPLYMDGSTWHVSVRTAMGLERVSRQCPEAYTDEARHKALCQLGLLFDEASGWPIPRPWLSPRDRHLTTRLPRQALDGRHCRYVLFCGERAHERRRGLRSPPASVIVIGEWRPQNRVAVATRL